MSGEPKKLALLRIFEILKDYSDADHPITQSEIAERLERDYDIELERKAIARNISLLCEAGVDIQKDREKRGVYLASRTFEYGELQMLIDSVLFSRHIPKKYAEDMVEKLRGLGNRYFNKSLQSVRVADAVYRSPSKEIFYVIETLNDAIAGDLQVSFMYNEYGTDKCLHPRWDSMRAVNPYWLVAANNNYYLIGNIDEYDNVANFRIDKITNIELSSVPRKNIRNTKSGLVRVGTYLSEHPYMLAGEPRSVCARVERDSIGEVIDAFGDSFSVKENVDGSVEVRFRASEEDAYLWALQHGDIAEIIGPQSLRDKLISTVEKMKNGYLKTEADRFASALASAQRSGELNISEISIKDKYARINLPNLTRLTLDGVEITDFSFVLNSLNLKAITVKNCPIADFSPLSQLKELKYLDIVNVNLSSVQFLRGMKLNRITLADCPIADFSPLYEMAGLKAITTGPFTITHIDVGRLRKTYPGIFIEVSDRLERFDVAEYIKEVNGNYPLNVMRMIFDCNDADGVGVAEFLEQFIPDRLDGDERTIFEGVFKEGKTFAQLAVTVGKTPHTLYHIYCNLLRKLRHPSSSRLLKKYVISWK